MQLHQLVLRQHPVVRVTVQQLLTNPTIFYIAATFNIQKGTLDKGGFREQKGR